MPLIATRGAASAQGFGEFAQSGPVNYIEDVFSTWLYTGNSSTQTITNNIDLSGKGGLVWIKSRGETDGTATAVGHGLWDTARGVGTSPSASKALASNLTSAQGLGWTDSDYVSAFTSSGFTVTNGAGTTTHRIANHSFQNYASWTFCKQAKFFDVVTYTGNGTGGRTINHNLQSVPGCVIYKQTSAAGEAWGVYHRSLPTNYVLWLNTTDAQLNLMGRITATSSTTVTIGNNEEINQNGASYVMYLFAHDAGGFGNAGTDNVITCGSYTGNGSMTGPTITLGYEPQWILIKQSTNAGTRWTITDNMRGFPVTSAANQQILQPNITAAEVGVMYIQPTSTGFNVVDVDADVNTNGSTYIYIAIRRGPMKTPTSGTSVFDADTYTGDGGVSRLISSGFAADFAYIRDRNDGTEAYRQNYVQDRLRGGGRSLVTNSSGAEGSDTGWTNSDMVNEFQSNTGILVTVAFSRYNASSKSYVSYQFKRAPGFFDVVAYTGTGSARTINHNLGVAPELMIVKRRSGTVNWAVYNQTIGNTKYLVLYENDNETTDTTFWNNTSPTSSVFSLGSSATPNQNTQTYIAYLFASVTGVSKVGSYTGTGTTLQVNCDFTSGSRFVLIKRTDLTGDWYIWDSARGIVAGNDPYLLLNTTAAEVTNTDYVDTYSAGFEISSTAPAAINANGGTFIFLAIA
jgi:hypothetical protein